MRSPVASAIRIRFSQKINHVTNQVFENRGAKLRLYERAGVREYLTVLLEDERIIWQELIEGRFRSVNAFPPASLARGVTTDGGNMLARLYFPRRAGKPGGGLGQQITG